MRRSPWGIRGWKPILGSWAKSRANTFALNGIRLDVIHCERRARNEGGQTMTDALLPIAYPIECVPAIVGVPRTKIFQAIREHKLTARKVGRSTIVMRDDLVAWINLLPIKGRRFDTDVSVAV
jgi:hypothetical protein